MVKLPGNIHCPVFLLGATASGKSAAAIELARRLGGGARAAILAMDAMQVYRGADIGTSKPSVAERAEIPHGGLDLVDFSAAFDVAQYLAHAAEFLREQKEAGRRVIIIGGTGLYFRALTRGLCEAPQGPEELRAELAALSAEQLRERLKQVDAPILERIDAANPRRLARAIEVMEATGKSLSIWQAETPEPLVRDFTAYWIQREKTELNARIETRVEAMFAEGWMEEVRGLVEHHGLDTVQRFAGIGYRDIAEATQLRGQVRSQVQLGNEKSGAFLENSVHSVIPSNLSTLKRDISVATRQYAKRQLTWFAREPSLQAVMLTGNLSFSEALQVAGLPALL